MRYYSDTLKKIFDTEEELAEAESKQSDKAAEQERRKKEVDNAQREAREAINRYSSLLESYCKDYSVYTYRGESPRLAMPTFYDLLRLLE